MPEHDRQTLHDSYIATREGFRSDGEIRLPSEAIYVTASKAAVR
jgi:hypothetical protein